jgi:hypothetical protein
MQMKMRINILLFSLIILFLASCKTIVIPNYTTVDGLSQLEPGMNKDEVLKTLNNVYPYDIYNGEKYSCEVHQYKYKHPYQKISEKMKTKREGLRGNLEKYLRGGDAYVVYKDGALFSVHTNEKAYMASLLVSINNIENTCNPPAPIIRGCMDSTSLNFNPDAVEDDGSCEYCACGYKKNIEFNPKRPIADCNLPCIKDDTYCETCPTGFKKNPEFDPYRPKSACNKPCIPCIDNTCENIQNNAPQKKECGPCELIEAAKTSDNVVLNVKWDVDKDACCSKQQNKSVCEKSNKKCISKKGCSSNKKKRK